MTNAYLFLGTPGCGRRARGNSTTTAESTSARRTTMIFDEQDPIDDLDFGTANRPDVVHFTGLEKDAGMVVPRSGEIIPFER
ncbi:MAG: hypothetical protein ACI4QA_00260 [Candidatus Spyradosoma sp.]